MPIIINGGSRSARAWWSNHLQRADTNERVSVIAFRGLMHETVDEAFREMEAIAVGTQVKNFFYHANINPRADEVLTPAQWMQAVDTLEKNLGYAGLPRFVVEHEKAGRTHQHVIWSRIDPDLMIARSDSLNYQKHEQTSRELEIEFGLERGQSVLTPDREEPRPERRPKSWEAFRGQASGIPPQQVAAQVRELYAEAATGLDFARALDAAGYILCQGDQRGYCLLDQAGDVHSLGRRAGVKAGVLKAFMEDDVPLEPLPSVAQARALYRRRMQAPQPGGEGSADRGE